MNSAVHTAGHAVDRTRSSIADFGVQALKLVNSLKAAEGRSMDSMLHRMGLQRRDEAMSPVIWFAAGAIAAGAIVFVLAPEAGKKVRARIVNLWESRVAHPKSTAHGMQQELPH